VGPQGDLPPGAESLVRSSIWHVYSDRPRERQASPVRHACKRMMHARPRLVNKVGDYPLKIRRKRLDLKTAQLKPRSTWYEYGNITLDRASARRFFRPGIHSHRRSITESGRSPWKGAFAIGGTVKKSTANSKKIVEL
jgi:hypothetical protein